MRMSCGGWTGGPNPPFSSGPRRNSLAYRRYLRFLPPYGFLDRDASSVPAREQEPEDHPSRPEEEEGNSHDRDSVDNEMNLALIKGREGVAVGGDGGVVVVVSSERPPRERAGRQERQLLRARGVNRWLKDQEESHASEMRKISSSNNDNESGTDGDRKDSDKIADVSVNSLVRQYTAMLNARNTSANSLQTSRSCSNIPAKTCKVSSVSSPPRKGHDLKNTRHGSLDSGDGDSSDSLLGPRYRSFSLPWPGERWSSDPNIMAGTAAIPPAAAVSDASPVRDVNQQHSTSLARLDSGTSDEGCPRDGSTGPTPPMSPVFRNLGANHHLSGLITPFKSLSPASSVGSQIGSVEDIIPLARSRSLGYVLDDLIRSRSADSAVEVEDDNVPLSPVTSAAHQQVNGEQEECHPGGTGKRDGVDGGGDSGAPSSCGVCDESKHSGDWCQKSCDGGVDDVSEGKLPNGEIVCDEGNSSRVFCECNNKSCDNVDAAVQGAPNTSNEETVELRRKLVNANTYGDRRERRCGEVYGDVLLRKARGCGGVAGAGVLQEIADEPCRKVFRTPSVVISDHSGDTISLTVALASSDFTIEKLDDKFHPSTVSPASSSPSLCVNDDASRKVSSCSSCSSVSTVDMTTPLTPMITPSLNSLMEVPQRRISDCSLSSNVTNSDEEIDHVLTRPPPPKKQSNWRKVRNIVQWTPFIQTYKKHKYPWVQLAGHQGNFRAGYKQGTILKKLCPAEEKALEAIMKDKLRSYVPLYMGVVDGNDNEKYLQLEDLLSDFELPCVMDIKMGVRTYLEDELAKAREKPKLRKDMYEKMVQIDPKAPTEAEHRAKAVTKPRYMVWRETISSTATQGFRIEGVRRGDGTSSKDFKTTRTRDQVLTSLNSFLQGYSHAASRYVQQLKVIKVMLEDSPFFNSHELIGSSLLFVHNETKATVRMIDFAKTIPLPENVHITHRSPWSEGTHEDGYLLGLDNLIDLFSTIEKKLAASEPSKTAVPNSTPVQEQANISSSSNSNTTTTTTNCNSTDNSSTVTNTTTAIASPLPTLSNHTAVPVNASLT